MTIISTEYVIQPEYTDNCAAVLPNFDIKEDQDAIDNFNKQETFRQHVDA